MEVNLFQINTFLIFIKAGVLIILFFYVIFALLIIRQVDLMGKTIITTASPLLSALAIIHAALAIGLIILAWTVL